MSAKSFWVSIVWVFPYYSVCIFVLLWPIFLVPLSIETQITRVRLGVFIPRNLKPPTLMVSSPTWRSVGAHPVFRHDSSDSGKHAYEARCGEEVHWFATHRWEFKIHISVKFYWFTFLFLFLLWFCLCRVFMCVKSVIFNLRQSVIHISFSITSYKIILVHFDVTLLSSSPV